MLQAVTSGAVFLVVTEHDATATADSSNTPIAFGKMVKSQGAWPFRCSKILPCPDVRRQTCGCEEPNDVEISAIVYNLDDAIQTTGK